jgi:hypothetical protein
MSCASPSDARVMNYVRSMEARIRNLERNLAGFHEITGACTTAGQSIVAVIGNVQDPGTGVFTLIWLSTPGETYQVQTSTDAINWTIAENVVEADADPAITTEWLSAAYDPIDETPRYFRVRRYPQILIPCPAPTAPPCPDILVPEVT